MSTLLERISYQIDHVHVINPEDAIDLYHAYVELENEFANLKRANGELKQENEHLRVALNNTHHWMSKNFGTSR